METVNEARPTAPTTSARPVAPAGDEPADLRRIAEGLVSEAAEYLDGLPRPWDERGGGAEGVATKSTPTDVVTASDHALEAFIRTRLGELRPDDAVVGEEHGSTAGESRTVWLVDPIDGTVNFMYGMPWYAISVAAVRDGASVAGAVIEPSTRRLWSAAVGAGATCDGRPLRVSGATDVSLSLLGTGFSYRAERRTRQVRMIGGMLPHVRDVRRAGVASLDLCAVAAGWADAYLEHGLNWWDWAAAALIAQEAGALVRTPPAR